MSPVAVDSKATLMTASRGQVSQLQTTTANFASMFTAGALSDRWHEIPRVIQDAIDLTDRLQERFLWVDSLCIVQDSDRKQHELKLMAEIYNSATMTIIAARATNADQPLRLAETFMFDLPSCEAEGCALSSAMDIEKLSNTLRDRYKDIQFAMTQKKIAAAMQVMDRAESGVQYCQGDRHDNSAVRRPLDAIEALRFMQSSRYSTRGWTFQESLLSRRKLVFHNHGVLFRCRSDIFCPYGGEPVQERPTSSEWHVPSATVTERRFFRGRASRARGNRGRAASERTRSEVRSTNDRDQVRAFERDLANYHQHMHREEWSVVLDDQHGVHTDRRASHEREIEFGFQLWSAKIEEYSGKDLKYEWDVLQACSAILQALYLQTDLRPVQGTPYQFIMLGLLWIPVGKMRRRTYRKIDSMVPPSWSWAGWIGKISYELAREGSEIRPHLNRLEDLSFRVFTTQADSNSNQLTSPLFLDALGLGTLRGKEFSLCKCVPGNASGIQERGCKQFPVYHMPRSHGRDMYHIENSKSKSRGVPPDDENTTVYTTYKQCFQDYPSTAYEEKPFSEMHSLNNHNALILGFEAQYVRCSSSTLWCIDNVPGEDLGQSSVHLKTREGHVCGVIYGVEMEHMESPFVRQVDAVGFILLSDCQIPSRTFRDNLARCDRGQEPVSGTVQESWPVKLIMLVRQCNGFYERVGIGEIIGQTWNSLSPDSRTIMLR